MIINQECRSVNCSVWVLPTSCQQQRTCSAEWGDPGGALPFQIVLRDLTPIQRWHVSLCKSAEQPTTQCTAQWSPHNRTWTDWPGTRVLAFLGHSQTDQTPRAQGNPPFVWQKIAILRSLWQLLLNLSFLLDTECIPSVENFLSSHNQMLLVGFNSFNQHNNYLFHSNTTVIAFK